MLEGISLSLIIVVLLALSFDFINGFHDTANAIATAVSTRALSLRAAIIMAAVMNFVGAMVSTKVAKTIAGGIVYGTDGKGFENVIIAALLGAILWNLITWYFGIPSSSTHALIGALVGASVVNAAFSFSVVNGHGFFEKVIIPLVASPVIGFVLSMLIMRLFFIILKPLSQHVVNKYFTKLQIVSSLFASYAHGNNDAQKSMGIIFLTLVSSGILTKDAPIPIWVKVACALAMALGTSIGGWRIIKTMGVSMIKLQPIGGFVAQTASAAVIEVASALGSPLSTTHVISSSIMGVGAAKRASAVRWGMALNIVWAWILTLPVTMVFGGIIVFIIKLF